MPDMGRGITAPAAGANIITGAAEMQTLGSTTATAIDDVDSRLSASVSGLTSAVAGKADRGDLGGPMPTLRDTDLDEVRETGMWRTRASLGITNYPAGDLRWARFRSWYFVGSGIIQEWDVLRGRTYRRNWNGTEWSEWVITSGSGGTGVGGESRTVMEVTGRWTSRDDETAYLDSLAEHEAVTLLDLGTSVEGRTVRGVQLGDKIGWHGRPNPTVLIMATQHGDEMGAREGALIFARELAQAKTMLLFNLCVVIVPTVNIDRVDVSRVNANGENINRDWESTSRVQPETQAILNVFADYPVVAAVDAHGFGYPQEVSIRETRNPGATAAVTERSQRLYDAVFSVLEDEGQPVRMYGDPGDPTTVGTFVHEVSAVDGIPPLLIEIPSHRNTYGRYSPNPHWQAHAAALAFQEVVQVVWHELDQFEAAKEAA